MNIIWVKRYLWIVAILLRLCGSIESIYVYATYIYIMYSFNAPFSAISFYICCTNYVQHYVVHNYSLIRLLRSHSQSCMANIREWFSLFLLFRCCSTDFGLFCEILCVYVCAKCYEDNYCKAESEKSRHLEWLSHFGTFLLLCLNHICVYYCFNINLHLRIKTITAATFSTRH